MSEALEIALERGLRKLDLEILAEVYDNIFAAPRQQSGDLAFGEFLDKESLEKGRRRQAGAQSFPVSDRTARQLVA